MSRARSTLRSPWGILSVFTKVPSPGNRSYKDDVRLTVSVAMEYCNGQSWKGPTTTILSTNRSCLNQSTKSKSSSESMSYESASIEHNDAFEYLDEYEEKDIILSECAEEDLAVVIQTSFEEIDSDDLVGEYPPSLQI